MERVQCIVDTVESCFFPRTIYDMGGKLDTKSKIVRNVKYCIHSATVYTIVLFTFIKIIAN